MSDKTHIGWTDSTWNPLIGCAKVSAGCKNCYAATLNERYGWTTWGGEPRRSAEDTFNAPLRWAKRPWVCDQTGEVMSEEAMTRWMMGSCASGFHRRRVFLGSLMDLFYEHNRIEDVAAILDIIRRTPQLDYLVLTKRPERVMQSLCDAGYGFQDLPTHVWLGVSVENQEQADKRIPELLKIPARVRWLSVEPLLEPVALLLANPTTVRTEGNCGNWVIVGGESGTHRRDCGVDAIVSVANQCQTAGVPVFVKQDCAFKPGQQGRIPDAIWRLKQFPKVNP